MIDPFLKGNPRAAVQPDEVDCDIVVVTHGHGDHFGDCLEIARRNRATLCAQYEIAAYAATKGVKSEEMNKGGTVVVGKTRVRLVEALHSSDLMGGEGVLQTLGTGTGVILETGKTVYHAGDTGLFTDMKLIGERYKPDIAFLPIGDRYTMGPMDAGTAAAWINAPITVPMHYQTFPAIPGDPHEFAEAAKAAGYKGQVRILQPGDTIDF